MERQCGAPRLANTRFFDGVESNVFEELNAVLGHEQETCLGFIVVAGVLVEELVQVAKNVGDLLFDLDLLDEARGVFVLSLRHLRCRGFVLSFQRVRRGGFVLSMLLSLSLSRKESLIATFDISTIHVFFFVVVVTIAARHDRSNLSVVVVLVVVVRRGDNKASSVVLTKRCG
ncbi:uncharacterized protein J3D65DRAFT_620574 [Phyllosticta citribraziliensis]|uniref:Uncharacterized protein n=1 Tax=Phyllosticta citribraziliensis TaxID=989973 RepID=A0ABR1LZH2_9PEZI